MTDLGAQAVLAAPLPPAGRLGAVCAYGRQPAITDQAAAASARIAATLAHALVQVAPYLRDKKGGSALRRFGLTDEQAVVHQAAGVVSVHSQCSIGDALALLEARAFAGGQVALAVVRDGLRLD